MFTIISHDAGGAEVLSSYIAQKNLDCWFVLGGPASKIFENKLGDIKKLPLLDAINQSSFILCGTSWQSDLEYNAIKLARSLGVPSKAFLDHWINYKERFVRNNEMCLPDEIWVGDAFAEEIAKKIFPNMPIRLEDNPYFHEICQNQALTSKMKLTNSEKSVLYVCEPIREHALIQYGDERYWGYTEEDALRYFLSNINLLGRPIDKIVIRPHPSESTDKYSWVQSEFDFPIEMGRLTLAEEIASSDIVVGCQSMAMVIALFASKKVISSIPPGGVPCTLPHSDILYLQQLEKEMKNNPGIL